MSKNENTENRELEVSSNAVGEAAAKPKNEHKKLKFGSMSVVVIILVIAIVIIINLLCSALMSRYPVKLDLTPDKRYELTDETIEVLRDLDQDVEITVTAEKETFDSMSNYFKSMYLYSYGMNVDCPYDIIPEILEKYSVYAESGKGSVDVKFVDINRDPDVVTRYSKYYNGEIGEGSIVIYSNERIKVISNEEVIAMIAPNQASTQNAITMNFAGESTITSAIMSVTDAKPVKVAYVTAMNTGGIHDTNHSYISSSVESFLSKNGYDVEEIDIAVSELSPEDYDMVAVVAPAVDFSADIIDKLGDFLYNDGKYDRNMLYVANYFATGLTNIDEFLADWSVQIEEQAVLDENQVQVGVTALGQYVQAPSLSIANADYAGELPNETLPIVAPYTRPLTILSKNNESVAEAVLTSQPTAYIATLGDGELHTDQKGTYNAVVVSRKENAEGFNTFASHVMVIGSPFMADSTVLSSTNTYNNATVLLNMINTMTGKEAGKVIPEKALQQSNIAPTSGQANAVRVAVIVVIPVLVAITGVIVLLRRRNK